MAEAPSESTLRQASAGDPVALDALLARYLPGLRGWLRLRAGDMILDRESVDDLAQSVCREVLENIDVFRFGGEAGFRKWLYLSAQRKIGHRVEDHRAKRRDVRLEVAAGGDGELLEIYQSFCTPSRELQAGEAREQIESCMDALPPDQREVVLMAKFVCLSHAEIAKDLGKSEGAVRVLLSRGLANLAARLAP